ncbi:helix-turn-helix transcriptional regulator [Ammoniphilus sp. CFH 90114]|uniref:helix-turn-helix transcriptional regulator n=1 Tax=Ammoniphilus sp. CFH 90114 TaxID=2493665 RepID=UPI00100F72DA|nr:helix-turn-helix transcriptional regulator [Ammoniphilus sp. CFH 90114]RXT03910.1 transcriptional regulator [Ammoniphilus sp. CFH 90114]
MSPKFKKQLKNRLVVLRAEKGWTQKDVADRIGVSRQTIISIEKDKYTPSVVLAFELADLFEKDINEVFQYVEEGEE